MKYVLLINFKFNSILFIAFTFYVLRNINNNLAIILIFKNHAQKYKTSYIEFSYIYLCIHKEDPYPT